MANKKIKITAKTIVAYQDGGHKILEDGCIVIQGNEVIFVGKNYYGDFDEHLDCQNRVITPGFISTHAHLCVSPFDKTIREDVGNRNFYYSGLADIIPNLVLASDAESLRAGLDYSMIELIRGGTTTVMEIDENGEYGNITDYIADMAEQVGIRAYISQGYQSYFCKTDDGKTVTYDADEYLGLRELEKAISYIERIEGRGNGRIKGFLSPMTDDTSTEELLVRSKEASDQLQVPLTLHTVEWVSAYQENVRRHGISPIEWLEAIGFYGEWTILGHVMFVSGHSRLNFPGRDLEILAKNQATISHNPWAFGRYGVLLESFSKYQEMGINICLGTDTSPQSMIESMKLASIGGKVISRDCLKPTATDVFNSATINPDRVLHRTDLGKITVGSKADLLFWNANSLVPCRDVIKAIVYSSSPIDLKDVMIDGEWVMRDSEILTFDEEAVCKKVQTAGEMIWSKHGQFDWAHRTADDFSPPSYPTFIA